MTLLLRFWPYFAVAGLALLIGVIAYIYHAGQLSERAVWQPRLEAAANALAAANAHAETLAAVSTALSRKAEADYDQTLETLRIRADVSDGRVRELLRSAARRASGQSVPAIPNPAPGADDPQPFILRPDTLANGLGAIARDCEADASELDALNAWLRDQKAILH